METSPSILDIFNFNGESLVSMKIGDRFVMLSGRNGDTIIPYSETYSSLHHADYNQDGLEDLKVSIRSNTPNQSETYLFHPEDRTFVKLANCDLDFEKVPGSEYFYSYNRDGCADFSWQSHLFLIRGDSAVIAAELENKQCGERGDGIFVYRVKGLQRLLIESLPVKTFSVEGADNKFDFIQAYWTANARRFE
ncbi:MAG: hypothetical protein EOO45_03975 [Flavobacterium sp.]|nr:MAG: hypothetical protein EOO45_03975 [Flavobacterium sp.]